MSTTIPIRVRTNPHLFLDSEEAGGLPGLTSVRCNSCGRYTIARPLCCSYCLSRDLTLEAAGQCGEVLEASVVHHPAGGFAAPYVIAQVRTTEGMTLFTPILGAAEPIEPGAKVAFTLYDRADGALGFAFRRATDGETDRAGF